MSSKVPYFNQIIISGNLAGNPIMRYIGEKNTPFCSFTVANNRRYLDKNENWQDETTFIEVESWHKQAEKAGANLKKGSPVIIEGNLHAKHWEDSNGRKHQKYCIKADRILSCRM